MTDNAGFQPPFAIGQTYFTPIETPRLVMAQELELAGFFELRASLADREAA